MGIPSLTCLGIKKEFGIIVDSASQQPVEYGTVSLIDNETYKTITGSVSNAQGYFSMVITKTGNYSLLFESIGFVP